MPIPPSAGEGRRAEMPILSASDDQRLCRLVQIVGSWVSQPGHHMLFATLDNEEGGMTLRDVRRPPWRSPASWYVGFFTKTKGEKFNPTSREKRNCCATLARDTDVSGRCWSWREKSIIQVAAHRDTKKRWRKERKWIESRWFSCYLSQSSLYPTFIL